MQSRSVMDQYTFLMAKKNHPTLTETLDLLYSVIVVGKSFNTNLVILPFINLDLVLSTYSEKVT